MHIRLFTAALVVLMTATTAHAQFARKATPPPGENYHVEIGLNWWSPTPELSASTDALNILATNSVDFVKEFGIDKERFTEFHATLKPGRKHKIRVAHVPIEYNKAATLQRTVTFGGRTFSANLPATADLKWDLWRIGYEWDFISRSRGFLGFITELKYNKVNANIVSTLGTAGITDRKAPVPTIGLIARGYIQRNTSITAEFTGFKTPDSISDTIDAKFYDVDVYATGNLNRFIGVRFGYRSITADYLVDDDSGNLKMKGPYFGGSLRF